MMLFCFFLRLTPFLPNWFINLAAPLVGALPSRTKPPRVAPLREHHHVRCLHLLKVRWHVTSKRPAARGER